MAREDARGQVVLVPLGVPPALPGRHKKFDSSGSPSRTLDDVSRQAHAEEVCDGREQKPKPYEVGVQISCGVYSQVPAQSAVQGIASAFGRGIPATGEAERE